MREPALSASVPAPATAPPEFSVIAETDDYIVVDKPALLLVHPTKPGDTPTLWRQLQQFLAFELVNGGQVSIVNRLDRETSGLVLVAKTQAAARRFGQLMEQRRFEKEYHALVNGWPAWETQRVDQPLARQGVHEHSPIYLKQSIHPAGAPALTDFVVERRFTKTTSAGEKFSLVTAIPRSGRTHQIRVHLAHLGHPLVGDKIYGADERAYLRFIETGWTGELARTLLLPRHALHASRLALPGEADWRCPLPPDLRAWLADADASSPSLPHP